MIPVCCLCHFIMCIDLVDSVVVMSLDTFVIIQPISNIFIHFISVYVSAGDFIQDSVLKLNLLESSLVE